MNITEAVKRSGILALLLAVAILILPSTVLACACCGVDDSWRVQAIPRTGYEAEIVGNLQLGPGQFTVSADDEEDWPISKVERHAMDFVFISEKGRFIFSPTKAPEHRMVDITFITQPQYQLEDSADIYHEVVLVGVLQVPTPAMKYFGGSKVDVTLVLRGVGNMCFGSETLNRWLISRSKKPFLRGSGVLAEAGREN